MGISGLHPVVKPYLSQVHVSKFRGQRVGCDVYAWLHRGTVGCAADLAAGNAPWQEQGYPAPFVKFCLKMVALLKRNGVIPVLVFDGGRLPAKAQTHQERQERKQAVLERGQELLERGLVEEARALLAQTVDVTPEMAAELIAYLRQQGVEFVVAPYEADSQLAFLSSLPPQWGGVAAVITEDSDLIPYGCRTLLFKCDTAGNAQELCINALFNGPPPQLRGTALTSFAGWDLAMLQGACVLAGCDFLASIPGVGFKTAHRLIKSGKSLDRALSMMKLEKRYQLSVTQEYMQAARRALHNFRHPVVFDANGEGGGALVRLAPLPTELEGDDLGYLGPHIPADLARGIAYGHLHPRTHQPCPGAAPPPHVTPTLATRQRLGSWMVPATSHLGPRPGLSPSHRATGRVLHASAQGGQRRLDTATTFLNEPLLPAPQQPDCPPNLPGDAAAPSSQCHRHQGGPSTSHGTSLQQQKQDEGSTGRAADEQLGGARGLATSSGAGSTDDVLCLLHSHSTAERGGGAAGEPPWPAQPPTSRLQPTTAANPLARTRVRECEALALPSALELSTRTRQQHQPGGDLAPSSGATGSSWQSSRAAGGMHGPLPTRPCALQPHGGSQEAGMATANSTCQAAAAHRNDNPASLPPASNDHAGCGSLQQLSRRNLISTTICTAPLETRDVAEQERRLSGSSSVDPAGLPAAPCEGGLRQAGAGGCAQLPGSAAELACRSCASGEGTSRLAGLQPLAHIPNNMAGAVHGSLHQQPSTSHPELGGVRAEAPRAWSASASHAGSAPVPQPRQGAGRAAWQQQAAPRWRTRPAQAKRRTPFSGAGIVKKGSGGTGKKGAPTIDASQMRISSYFAVVPQ